MAAMLEMFGSNFVEGWLDAVYDIGDMAVSPEALLDSSAETQGNNTRGESLRLLSCCILSASYLTALHADLTVNRSIFPCPGITPCCMSMSQHQSGRRFRDFHVAVRLDQGGSNLYKWVSINRAAQSPVRRL